MQVILNKKLRKKPKFLLYLRLHRCGINTNKAILQAGNRYFFCAIGEKGITSQKREGDGATPQGVMRFLSCYYKQSFFKKPQTRLPRKPIKAKDGWCDTPQDANYNRQVVMPYRQSAENLCRGDTLYDIIIILDFNISKRVKFRGSAIFMHVASKNYGPTRGCVALKAKDLALLLPYITTKTKIIVCR